MSDRTEQFHWRFMFLLAPGILQAVAGILVLPLATLILTPEDYGIFGMVTGVTAAASAIVALGSSFIIGNHFDARNKHADNVIIVSTMVWLVFLTGILISAVVAICFWVGRQYSSLISDIPYYGILFAVIDIIASALWGLATSVAVLSRMTSKHAVFASVRALISPLVLLYVLFVLDIHGPIALFAGLGAAGVVSLVGSWSVTRPYLRICFDRLLAEKAVRMGAWLVLANFAEAIERIAERWALAFFVNVRSTGLLTHSQIYPSALILGIRPAVQAAWPILREEAIQTKPIFSKGRYLVHLIGLTFGVASLVLALIGAELIGLLTNNRFVEVAPIAAILVSVAGLRLSGCPQHAVVVANGHAGTAALVNGISALSGIVLVLVLVPFFGLNGAIMAQVGYGLVFLGLLHMLSRRIRRTPMLDATSLIGFVLTLVTVWGVVNLNTPVILRLVLAVLVTVAGLALAWKIVLRSGLRIR